MGVPESPESGAVCGAGVVVLPVVSPPVLLLLSATGACVPPLPVAMLLRLLPRYIAIRKATRSTTATIAEDRGEGKGKKQA